MWLAAVLCGVLAGKAGAGLQGLRGAGFQAVGGGAGSGLCGCRLQRWAAAA